MSLPANLILPYFVLWATLMKALLIKANVVPASCGRCGKRFERRELGEPICGCGKR